MTKLHALKPNATIGIAASASHFDKNEFLKGVEKIKSWGYRVYFRDDIFDKDRYLAGSDNRRAEELIQLLSDPQIDAVFFARGGYGMMRLLPALERAKNKLIPKIVLGYSDITSLHLFLNQKLGWPTFYGPVVAKDISSKMDLLSEEHLKHILSHSDWPLMHAETAQTICGGVARGKLVGGCLSLVIASLATPYEIETTNSLLFLEDTNEKPYAIDRMLTQLVYSKKLENVRGVIFGHFENSGQAEHIREAIEDVLKNYSIPMICHFPAGHGQPHMTLPLGAQIELDADKKTIQVLESPVYS